MTVPTPSSLVLVGLLLPDDLHEDLDTIAGERGVSLPDFIVNLLAGWNLLSNLLNDHEDV